MKTESTPFARLDISTPKGHKSDENGGIWARFYWSKNSGVYGHQVVTEYNTGDGFKTEKTGGYGFCKKSAALESFLSNVNGSYIGLGGDLDYYLGGTKHNPGGNQFNLNIEDITKIDKLRK